MKMKKTIIKTKDSSLEKRSTQQIVEEGKVFTPEEWIELQRIMKNPKIITNTLEFFTGIASAKRTDLILSVGHIIQGLFKGKLRSQLFSELGKYRKKGKISDKNLNSKYGKTQPERKPNRLRGGFLFPTPPKSKPIVDLRTNVQKSFFHTEIGTARSP